MQLRSEITAGLGALSSISYSRISLHRCTSLGDRYHPLLLNSCHSGVSLRMSEASTPHCTGKQRPACPACRGGLQCLALSSPDHNAQGADGEDVGPLYIHLHAFPKIIPVSSRGEHHKNTAETQHTMSRWTTTLQRLDENLPLLSGSSHCPHVPPEGIVPQFIFRYTQK